MLFGSSARGDTNRESDVDLLIDTPEPGPLEPEVRKQVSEFERSVKVTRYWQLLGVRPVISVQVERLENWTALHLGLLKDGRVLYGPFTELTPKGGATVALLSWKDVPSLSVRTNLYRTLSGYVSRGQRYPGLLERHQGQRIAKGAILVPLSSLDVFKKGFQRLRVAYRVRVLSELT